MNPNYKQLTVRDIVDAVMKETENFPLGLDTPIQSGDFEGNYTHSRHQIMTNRTNFGKKAVKTLFLGYEQHEGHWSEEG